MKRGRKQNEEGRNGREKENVKKKRDGKLKGRKKWERKGEREKER